MKAANGIFVEAGPDCRSAVSTPQELIDASDDLVRSLPVVCTD